MRIFKLILLIVLPVAGLVGFANHSFASSAGTDNAAQSAYSGGWLNGTNGEATGDAFLPWSFATSGTSSAGFFIGDSTNLGSPGANINVGGSSWGMYANGGDPTELATAQRSFTSDGSTVSALSIGQTFSLSIAVNFTDGNKGFNLLDGSNDTIFDLNIGSGFYNVSNAATGNGNLPNPNYDQDTAFALSFTQTSDTSGTWSVIRSGGQTDSASGTYAGDAAGFKLYVSDNSGGPSDDLYANSASVTTAVVPEPSSAGLLACSAGALLLMRKRRWS
jgi:hypothetical protein